MSSAMHAKAGPPQRFAPLLIPDAYLVYIVFLKIIIISVIAFLFAWSIHLPLSRKGADPCA